MRSGFEMHHFGRLIIHSKNTVLYLKDTPLLLGLFAANY